MNFAQGSQEFRIESQNLSKQRKLFLGERSTEQRTGRISGELKELSDVCLYPQLLAGAEFFPRAISCTQATQSDTINSIASAG